MNFRRKNIMRTRGNALVFLASHNIFICIYIYTRYSRKIHRLRHFKRKQIFFPNAYGKQYERNMYIYIYVINTIFSTFYYCRDTNITTICFQTI